MELNQELPEDMGRGSHIISHMELEVKLGEHLDQSMCN